MQTPFRLSVAALAAGLALVAPAGSHRADAFELIQPAEEREIAITVGAGQLVRVNGDFASLFVANPDVADIEVRSSRMLYLTGVGVGETTIFAVDDADEVLMSARVRVTHNTDALAKGLARVAPGVSVSATSVDQSLVVTGTVANAEQAANVIEVARQFVDDPSRVVNRLNVAAPTQVNLMVRIAEVSRKIDRQIGIRWNELSYTSGGGNESVRFSGGGGPVRPGSFATQILRVGQLNIDVVLRALSEEGLVSILAEPNLTARSGETASFLAGGEYPYTVAQDQGANTIEFKDFGIGLNFTPTVLDGGRISLKVATEVSELDFQNGTDVPSILTRRADTTVDLGSGQTFAIAGLMQNRSAQNASRMPGLGAVPVVGALFRSSGFLRGQTELVILVTPVIVQPTTGARLRTPTDAYVPPNDFERIVLGRFQGDARAAGRVQSRLGQRRLNGASGFVFD